MIKYGIILTDGQTIYIKADYAEWDVKERMVLLINERNERRHVVARINMDNVVGYINADNIVGH